MARKSIKPFKSQRLYTLPLNSDYEVRYINLTTAYVDDEDKIKNDIIFFIFSVVTYSNIPTLLTNSRAGPTSTVISHHFVIVTCSAPLNIMKTVMNWRPRLSTK